MAVDHTLIDDQAGHQRRDILRQLVSIGRSVGHQYLADALDALRRSHGAFDINTGDQHMNLTANLLRRSDRVQRRGGKLGVGVFGNYQNSHQITFASFFSFSTSSATDLTLIPALRAAGASTFRVLLVEAVETPSASGVTVSSGFFLAFMMFGSDA
ncbi:hypothetical protein D3C78_1032680 [compost metagenome]